MQVVLLEQAESPATMSSRCLTPKECNYVTTTNKTNNKANQQVNQQSDDDRDELQQHTHTDRQQHRTSRVISGVTHQHPQDKGPTSPFALACPCPPLRHNYRRHCRPTAAYILPRFGLLCWREQLSYTAGSPQKSAP